MEILWLAIIIYSIGLGGILHVKPALMFGENGTWKEFGYQRSPRHTMFPFWLFAITWAFASYAIAASITWMVPVATLAASFNTDSDDYYMEPSSSIEPESESTEMEAKRGRGRPRTKPRPGYYVVDPDSLEAGVRKYIYYGSEPPT